MSNDICSPENTTKKETLQRITSLRFRGLWYVSLYVFILFVYGGAVVTDYLLFKLMWWVLRDDVEKYPLVALGLDYARVGLALLFIVAAVVHGMISTYSQIQLDFRLSQDGREGEQQ